MRMELLRFKVAVHYKNVMLAPVGSFHGRVDFVTLYFGLWIYVGTFEACFDGFQSAAGLHGPGSETLFLSVHSAVSR
jgi:hypothetical protein